MQRIGRFAGIRKIASAGVLQIVAIICLVAGALIYAQAPTEEEVLASSSVVATGTRSKVNPLVPSYQPKLGENVVRVTSTGTIIVRNSVELVLQTTGRVVWVSESLRRGGHFKAMEPLVQIDKSDFELAVAQASADTHAARSNFELATATSEAAIQNYAILNPDKVVPPLVAKTPQLEQAKAQIAAAQAREDIAKLNLDRTSFALPFNGRVVASTAELGQLLKEGQGFGEVFSEDAIEALVPLSTQELALLKPAEGRQATITIGAERYDARVVRVSPDLEERTRTAQLFLSIATDTDLYPGTFIEVEIEGPRMANTMLLPEAAEQIGEAVWTVSDGKLTKQYPDFVNRNDKGIVTQAFESGAGVVLGTIPGAFEGMTVDLAPAN